MDDGKLFTVGFPTDSLKSGLWIMYALQPSSEQGITLLHNPGYRKASPGINLCCLSLVVVGIFWILQKFGWNLWQSLQDRSALRELCAPEELEAVSKYWHVASRAYEYSPLFLVTSREGKVAFFLNSRKTALHQPRKGRKGISYTAIGW